MSPENTGSSPYDDWRNEFARERLRTLYYLGITANPVFLVSDLLFYRDQWQALLTLRSLLMRKNF